MKVLYITTIGGTMSFFKSFIRELLDEGHSIDIATNEKESLVAECYRDWNCSIHQIDCCRSPLNKGNLVAIRQIKTLVEKECYDIVHCHTPIAAMCTRIACQNVRKQGTKVFYTAHGFHFYKGAPLKNWLLYYPVEKICAHFTDVLITINQEDYSLAQKKMKARRVEYVAGVGINIEKFSRTVFDKVTKRKELGIPSDSILLVSVGELNKNKNQEVIIRAISRMSNDKIHYAIAGVGETKDYLGSLANELNVGNRIHLLGFRKDIAELYHCADICCFTSIREGLGLAAIEGMACGLPLIASDNRGTRDYAVDGVTGHVCQYNDIDGFVNSIEHCLSDRAWLEQVGKNNILKSQKYEVNNINETMLKLYRENVVNPLV